MASSVLGKRTRSSTEAASRQSLPRAKRQVRTQLFNDENENPLASGISHDEGQNGDSMDVDELCDTVLTKSTPVKNVLTGSRPPLSPMKITKCFSTAKTNNDENSKPIQIPTPHTPRHRDAVSKTVPSTPRHRVMVAGKALTPRTPRTLTPGGSLTTVYSQARQLFAHSSEPGRLVGREAERQELSRFAQDCISKTAGGCIYVSGPPGTGKSAMVNEVAAEFKISPNLKKAYINCMSMKTSKDLCGNLLENLCDELDILEVDELQALQSMFVPKKKQQNKTVYMVILDEVDHILTLDLEILYKLFEWSLQKSSQLILIGIANALDLTDRFLPRLKVRNLKPQLLPFLPYNASQIKTIIITRLKSLIAGDSPTPDYVPFLHPAAIDLCSRKVASQTGDLRKAFDICRGAIDLIESETKQKHEDALKEQTLQDSPSKRILTENINLSSPENPSRNKSKSLAQSLAYLTVETAPRASITHLNKITSVTFGNSASQRLKTLNLQQKAALCALMALEKRKRTAASNLLATPSKSNNAAPTIKALYDTYCKLCTRDSVLHPLTSTEFRDVIGSLETLSLISALDGRNGSFLGLSTPSKRKRAFSSGIGVGDEKRVGSCVGEREVAQAVEGLGADILKSILNGEGFD